MQFKVYTKLFLIKWFKIELLSSRLNRQLSIFLNLVKKKIFKLKMMCYYR